LHLFENKAHVTLPFLLRFLLQYVVVVVVLVVVVIGYCWHH